MWWAYRYITQRRASAAAKRLDVRRKNEPAVKTVGTCGPFVLVEYDGPGRPDHLMDRWVEVRGFSKRPTREDLVVKTRQRDTV